MTVAEKITLSKDQQVDLLEKMMLIRRFEEKCAEMYMRGKIGGFLHLYIGEEATGAGAISALSPEDYIVTHYREHGHALARGLEPRRIMAELFGRSTGTSKGKGGSMHLFDASKNFMGGYAIVGGMLPVATGLGLASQYLGKKSIACAIFGDGSVNEGEFHESMNLAAIWKLPVLFLLENNGYGMGTSESRASSYAGRIYHVADSYGIPSERVNGQDVMEVYNATKSAVDKIREQGGPRLIESVTYRFRGHSMADPAEYRDKAEEELWKQRDPILLFRQRLEKGGAISTKEFEALQRKVDAVVEDAAKFADESPALGLEAIYEDIYAV